MKNKMKVDDIQRILVIGAGIMGVGIAQGFAEANCFVQLFDHDKNILRKGGVQIEVS